MVVINMRFTEEEKRAHRERESVAEFCEYEEPDADDVNEVKRRKNSTNAEIQIKMEIKVNPNDGIMMA